MAQISVIVPIYKVEQYLRPCVDSILAQTFTDFELILVDDGSPDNCGAICDEYIAKDSRVHVIHRQNGGLSAARNAGIDLALSQGDTQWITFVDSDDLIASSYLEHMLTIVQDHQADIGVCQMIEFSQGNVPEFCFDTDAEIECLSGRDAAIAQYAEHGSISVSACVKLYRKELFSKLRFPVGRIHEDQAVTPIVLYNAATVAVTNQRLYGYRLREESIMHARFSAKRYDDIFSVDQCIAYYRSNNDAELVSLAERRRGELISIYSLLARKEKVYQEVPKEYRISERKALKWLRNNLSDDKYTFQLAKFHPNWLLPHAYWRKIKKTLHIPCN